MLHHVLDAKYARAHALEAKDKKPGGRWSYDDLALAVMRKGGEGMAALSDWRGNTAIHICARNGDAVLLKKMLTWPVDCNKKTKAGATALHVARRWGHDTVVALLLGKTKDAGSPVPLLTV